MRYGGVVSWSSRRQRSTACSLMHAEIMAANAGASEMAWIEALARDIGPKEIILYIPTLYMDNQSGID